MIDAHVHTLFSHDGISSMDEYMKAAKEKGVDEIIRMSEQYKETLPVYKEWYAISNPKKKADFETAHQGELMRFHMAERVLAKNYPDMRIPLKNLKKK